MDTKSGFIRAGSDGFYFMSCPKCGGIVHCRDCGMFHPLGFSPSGMSFRLAFECEEGHAFDIVSHDHSGCTILFVERMRDCEYPFGGEVEVAS
jgi:hypothetical protein